MNPFIPKLAVESRIDIAKFDFDGVEDLIWALIHSEHCPVNNIEENELGEKEL